MKPTAGPADSRAQRKRRTGFRLLRAKRQTGLAALVLAGCYALIIVFNLISERSATFVEYVPNLASIVILLFGAWLYGRDATPVAALPWIASVISLALVLLLLSETLRDSANPSVEYALIIMVVFSQFVLSFPAAVAAAIPMLVAYVKVATDAGIADLGDTSLIGATALAVGMVALRLRIGLADSLATALDEAESRSTLDSLTGALNRRGLAEDAQRGMVAAERRGDDVAVAFVDVDDMKPINDTHGHAAGDDVLRRVARALQSASRPSDLIARWGGDEFVVMSAANREFDVVAWAARLVAAVRESAVDHPSWEGSVTIGAAIGTPKNGDWQQLVDSADADMYRRKHRRATGEEGDE